MRIRTKYDFGQTVYLITDTEQEKRLVTSITLNPGNVVYQLSCGTTASSHYEFEISPEVNMLVKTEG